MTISPRFKEELRNRLILSDIIGRKVKLSRAGREFKGCCPFHNEKTPSFYVNDDKQFYHCFGCGAHGDAIGFTMQYDNRSFIEAIEQLSSEAGMEVPKATPQEVEQAKKQKSLHALLEEATKWMEVQLRDPKNAEAYQYMIKRGNTDEELSKFRVGYAPADGQAVRVAMKAKGYDDQDMIDAGILRAKEGRDPYAFFRERIIFPVPDRRGRVVAYGGRILPDHLRPPDRGDYTPAKYMNSSDTPLFNKGQMLYGEPRARKAAADGETIIVVEGYVDVMASVKAGYRGALAPLGTALTEDQIMILWKMIPQNSKIPVLCFDGDNAGRRAAARAVERILPLLQPDHSARIAFLPDGQDPDTLVNGQGKQAFDSIINAAMPLVDFIWHYHTKDKGFKTPEERAGLSALLDQEALKIPDRSVQHYYKQAFRERVNKAFSSYKGNNYKGPKKNTYSNNKFGGRNATQNQAVSAMQRPSFTTSESKLLAALINHPQIFDQFEEEIGMITIQSQRHDQMRQVALEYLLENGAEAKDDFHRYLAEQGFEKDMMALLNQNLYALARFCRPSADLEEVIEGWKTLYHALHAGEEGKSALN